MLDLKLLTICLFIVKDGREAATAGNVGYRMKKARTRVL